MNNESIQKHSVPLAAMPASNLSVMRNDELHNDDMLNRIGHVTRLLHDSLRGLGLDKIMEQVANDIPDARERLNYVAKMTEQAAERVLNATDAATPLQTDLASQAAELDQRWKEVLAKPLLKSDYDKAAARNTIIFSTYRKKYGRN